MALIKFTSPCICPIYSVVKVRPRQLALADPPERAWIASNPMFGVKETFFEPCTDSRLSHLTPNTKLGVRSCSLASPLSSGKLPTPTTLQQLQMSTLR